MLSMTLYDAREMSKWSLLFILQKKNNIIDIITNIIIFFNFNIIDIIFNIINFFNFNIIDIIVNFFNLKLLILIF